MNILEQIRDYHVKNIRLTRRIAQRDIDTIKRQIKKLLPITIQVKKDGDK